MKKRRRRRMMILIPVASIGDIAFLLVIFFVLCSRLAKDPNVDMSPATTAVVNELEDYPIVVVIDRDGVLYFQGEPVAGAEQVEAGVRVLVEGRTTDRAKTVLFRCDRNVVGTRVYVPVMEAIAKGGGKIAAAGEASKPE